MLLYYERLFLLSISRVCQGERKQWKQKSKAGSTGHPWKYFCLVLLTDLAGLALANEF
jgi:hypothetical protein